MTRWLGQSVENLAPFEGAVMHRLLIMLTAVATIGAASRALGQSDLAHRVADTVRQPQSDSAHHQANAHGSSADSAKAACLAHIAADSATADSTGVKYRSKQARADCEGDLTLPQVSVFASGALKNVVGSPGDATSTTGALGIRYTGHTFVISAYINVAGTSDTVTQGYGASVLPTSNGRALDAGLIDLKVRHLAGRDCEGEDRVDDTWCAVGFRLYGTASSTLWATDTMIHPIPATSVSVWGTGEALSWTFADGMIGSTSKSYPVTLILTAGAATRHLRGDITDPASDSVRLRLLGSHHINFVGPEVGLIVGYGTLLSQLTYVRFPGTIDGLSRGQVVASISVAADIISDKLRLR